MIFRTKEDFVKRIKKEVYKLSEEKRIVMNSPHLIKEIIIDEPRYIKKRLIIEWDILNDSENEEEDIDQKSLEEWTFGEEYRWENGEKE